MSYISAGLASCNSCMLTVVKTLPSPSYSHSVLILVFLTQNSLSGNIHSSLKMFPNHTIIIVWFGIIYCSCAVFPHSQWLLTWLSNFPFLPPSDYKGQVHLMILSASQPQARCPITDFFVSHELCCSVVTLTSLVSHTPRKSLFLCLWAGCGNIFVSSWEPKFLYSTHNLEVPLADNPSLASRRLKAKPCTWITINIPLKPKSALEPVS